MRLFRAVMVWGLLLAVAGCASMSQQGDKLDQQQYAWSGAIRWGEVEGAANLIDPKEREKHPVTDLQLERWKHIQVTSYRDIGSDRNLEKGLAVREIDIGVMNRHTMAERTVRYRETWRWDTEGKVWWLTSGLPDLWAGQ
ncbi:hypothetical protein [Aerolutibacter ruishenii]|uniref:Lipoprotein n=1 Tax=Aerolutibacter ruishenii TaxID=686800 RepID=A0A562M0Y8_9GAMM|nr:hypothetical protein [Lysobacter ruishenii]TWI13550.1 hypothetical protein IP93_00712 [Lysobacter ruishenii]